MKLSDLRMPINFKKHCEVVFLLACRSDKDHPAIKYHIRSAIRRATRHVASLGGQNKQRAHYMSKQAEEQMLSGNFENLICEHIIPISILTQMVNIALNEEPTPEKIESILLNYSLLAVITKSEDLLLNVRFKKGMPADWDEKNLYARYEAAGISLKPNRYKELKVSSNIKQKNSLTSLI